MRVDVDAIPTIIGKGGSTIKRLRDEYEVKVDVYAGRGSVRMKGDPEQVAQCKLAIESLLNDTILLEVNI